MFKKTLLALTIASVSSASVASTFATGVSEADATLIAKQVAGNCLDTATAYGVTLSNAGGFAFAATGTTDDTALTDQNTADTYEAPAVVMTAPNQCDIFSDVIESSDSALYSSEGAAANGISANGVLIAGLGGYDDEDTITIDITNGLINTALSTSPTLGAALTSIKSINTDVIRFTAGGAIDPFKILALDGLVVTPDAGSATLGASAVIRDTTGLDYDNTGTATTLVELATQYSASVGYVFDGIIDVQTNRENLIQDAEVTDTSKGYTDTTSEEDTAELDSAVLVATLETSQGNLVPTEGTITLTSTQAGGFSWMNSLDTDTATAGITTADLATGVEWTGYGAKDTSDDFTPGDDSTPVYSLNTAQDELTITFTVGGGALDPFHKIVFDTAQNDSDGTTSGSAISKQDYTASISVEDASENSADVATNVAVGGWDLNGSVVTVPYMPFGAITQPILRHTNNGSQTGNISARYRLETDGTDINPDWVDLGVVVTDAAPGMVNLLSPVMDAVVSTSGLASGKVELEITTNVPTGDVTVFAGAKITDSQTDRLTIGTFDD
jgi:hypothetical protein